MRATRLLIQAFLVLALAVPAALADEQPDVAEELPAAAAPAAEVNGLGEPVADAGVEPFAADLSPDGESGAAPAVEPPPADLDAAAGFDPTAEAFMDGEQPDTDGLPTAEAEFGGELSEPMPTFDEMGEPQSPEGGVALLPEAEEFVPPAALDPAALPAPGEPGFDSHPPLGAVGYDSEGRRGRIHIVVRGDTLWDISDAYLGTSWVWPSIWQDNGDIENPHLIYPGDRIWITPSEMRKITAEEADWMLSNRPEEPAPPAAEEEPVFDDPEPAPEIAPVIAEPIERGTLRVSSRESVGLISPLQLEASASIVGRVPERVLLAQEDEVYIGLGESDVEIGDQLTAFRTHEKVYDPDSGVLLGYHVEFLGWLEVTQAFPETAMAKIRMSTGGLQEGDRLIPREPLPAEIPLQMSPDGVEGKISFFPKQRVVIGYNDFVYLNRGTVDGLEVGSPLDVYRMGYSANESVRRDKVLVPDFVIGRMVVVRAEPESSVAVVTDSKTELALGDRFRGRDR